MNKKDILEPVNMFNKWGSLISSVDNSTTIATSQFFYPIDISYYIDLARKKEDSLVATEIWPSRFCNHCCIFCSSDIFGLNNKSVLEINTLKRLIGDLATLGNKLVRFSGGGEPFICNNLGSIIELIAERNMHSLFITNGTLFTDRIIRTLVQYASVVRVSLNGGNEEDYFKVHRVDAFNKVINNLQHLALERIRVNRERELILGVTFVIAPQNLKHLSDAVSIVKDCGFDFMLIRGINPIRYHFTGSDRTLLEEQLQKSHKFKDAKFFVSGSITKLDGAREKKKIFSQCCISNYRIFINSDGNVFPCFSSIMHQHESFGNIYQNSIREIWENNRHLKMKTNLLNGKFPNFCDKFCDHVEFNACMGWINEKIMRDKNIKFRKIPRSWAYKFIDEEAKLWF